MEVEQLLSLSGSALAQAVSSLLETPGLYVFSDILELPNVREVHTHTNTQSWGLNRHLIWDVFNCKIHPEDLQLNVCRIRNLIQGNIFSK